MSGGEPRWWDFALCREVGGEIFFGEDGDRGLVQFAKATCRSCDVAQACLEDALAVNTYHDRYGIRAGLTPHERARLRRDMNKGVAAA